MGTTNPSNSLQVPGSNGGMADESLQRALALAASQILGGSGVGQATVKLPSAPRNVLATSGYQSASVSWSAPAFGTPISYLAVSTPGNIAGVVTGTSAQFSGLTNGVAYTFSVQTVSGYGIGTAATSNSVTPSATVPVHLQIPNLAVFLDASQGSPGSTWADSSGSGNDAKSVLTVAGPYPSVFSVTAPTATTDANLNGKAVVAYSTNKGHSLPANFNTQTYGDKMTFFVVFDQTAAAASSVLFGNRDRTAALINYPFYSSLRIDTDSTTGTTLWEVNNLGNITLQRNSAALTLNTGVILSMTAPGALFLNGTKQTNLVNAMGKNFNRFAIACDPGNGGFYMGVNVAQVIIFNRVLSDAERHTVEAALGSLFNVTMAVQ